MIEKILQDLVAIPTVTGDFDANNKGLAYIEKYLQQRNMHISRKTYDGHGTLVATTRKTKHPKVMLVAHIDVVPGPKQLFTLKEKEGKLFGRGVFDMKHAVAAFLAAVDLLGEAASNYDFGVMIFTDDESTDTQIGRLLQDGYACDVAVLPDGSSDWQIESTAKGAWGVRVRSGGKSSHGSRPWEGDSASMKMIDFLHELKADFAEHGPATDTLNVSFLQSGSSAWNQLPDTAEATLDIRIIHETNHMNIKKRLEALTKKYQVTIEEMFWVPPVIHDMENPYLALFSDCIRGVTGIKGKGFMSFGTHSGRYFLARGIPCVITSPSGGGRHGNDEWIGKQGLLEFPEVIKRYIERVT
jgi:acetylornithine deacetylase/succinyl-diaminopimelate desuccinylase-like protein